MPQFDVSSFNIQLLWLIFAFGGLYIIVSWFIAPKVESVLTNRRLYLSNNISHSEDDRKRAYSLQKQQEEKIKELNVTIENIQKNALLEMEKTFINKNRQLEISLAEKTQEAFSKIQDYLRSFHDHEDQSCIDLASFIIEKITDKPADLNLLKKIYGTK